MSADLRFDVATLGEMMVLLAAEEPGPLAQVQSFRKRTAGAETNVAIGLARLGLRVTWASRLGGDSMGAYLLAEMQREGVDCSQVVVAPDQRTGFMLKGRTVDGSDPPTEYYRQGSAASRMTAEGLVLDWLLRARHLHATGVFAAVSAGCLAAQQAAMQAMRAAGRSVSFDPNLRPALWPSPQAMREQINALAVQADWLLPGLEEGRFLTGGDTPEAIAAFYRDRGVPAVVVKLGTDGAYYESASARGRVPAFPVERVVDTVGAGDGFAVGVISRLLEGGSLESAALRGAWIGARAVQVPGDTEGLPSRSELLAALL
jgi:sugar/nucleoside kinase (ribokinase family)